MSAAIALRQTLSGPGRRGPARPRPAARLRVEPLEAREVPATYYVAPTGSNGNSGTSEAPWLTLQHAANTVQAGDTVVVRAGTYAGFVLTRDGTAAAPITFSAEAGVTVNAPIPSGPGAGRDGINLEGADYAVIEGFNVIGMPRAGIRSVTNTGAVIRNNVADANTVWGIFTGFSENVRIENNVTSRSAQQHGIYVSNSADNPVVRGNRSWGNYAAGIHMNSDVSMGGDGVITGARIENNVIYDNGRGGGAGINMDGVSDSRVQNNLLYGNHATGIALYRIDGAHGAWNNVVANNTVHVAADGRWALLINDASTGNRVFNNVFLNDHLFRGSMAVSADSLPGLVSDYNVVMDRFSTDAGGTRVTLAEWRAQTGQDTHSVISTAAALFADPANANYHLAVGSPALDAGTAALGGAAAPTSALGGAGRPSGAGYDVGAYETQQGPTGPPTANPDAYTVPHDRTLTEAAAGVLGNDVSNPAGRPLTAALVTGPLHGTVTLNADGSFTYTPAAGYTGPDAFTYTANDAGQASAPATVSLLVTNQAPVAANNSYTVVHDRTLTVAAAGVLGNDTDADGDALTATLVTGPSHGTLTLNADGSFTYTPAAGYTGPDAFTYAANDGVQDSAAATVNLSVTSVGPPRVNSVVVNDGSAQRSLVRSITVTFDTVVTFDAGAFSLVRDGGGNPTRTARITTVNGQTVVRFTFSGSATQYGSLADGHWTFRVIGSRVHRADDRAVTMGADLDYRFHRLFGDSDGDRDVDAADQAAFDRAFGQTDAASLAVFDYDNNKIVKTIDRNQFTKRFGRTI